MDSTAKLAETFVTVLNSRGLKPLFDSDVPKELRTQELPEIANWFEWKIRSAGANDWVPPLEERLPYKFPPLYRYLISRFRFAEFEIGPIMFFANTGTNLDNELSRSIFVDRHLHPVLLENGFVQFGRQAGGGYDPVCFAMKRSKRGDAPIVQVDHEDVLMKERIREVAEMAPSFQSFAEQVIAGRYFSRQ